MSLQSAQIAATTSLDFSIRLFGGKPIPVDIIITAVRIRNGDLLGTVSGSPIETNSKEYSENYITYEEKAIAFAEENYCRPQDEKCSGIYTKYDVSFSTLSRKGPPINKEKFASNVDRRIEKLNDKISALSKKERLFNNYVIRYSETYKKYKGKKRKKYYGKLRYRLKYLSQVEPRIAKLETEIARLSAVKRVTRDMLYNYSDKLNGITINITAFVVS